MNNHRRSLLLALAAAPLAFPVLAAGPANVDARGVAIHGHDRVAYFVDEKPVMGKSEHSATVGVATYWFASGANLQLFKTDPAKYEPQYGGYCAYGVAKDGLVKVEPDQFTVRNGKLYLNFDADVQALWLKDPDGFIKQADAKFPALLKQ